MPELLLFVFLTLLLAVVLYGKWRPILKENRTLDVEEKLPLPWVGHASTVFSLTALFGAYLGILIIKGMVAVIGLALGSLIGLLLIRSAIDRSPRSRYHNFLLERRFSQNPLHDEAFWILVAFTQLGYAASELVILIRISEVGMHLGPLPSAVLAVTVATIGYLYCLHGGYVGVFRTDVVQFLALGVMLLLLGIGFTTTALTASTSPLDREWLSSSVHWNLGLRLHWSAQFALDLTIGMAMGAAFLIASPDAWKRMIATVGTGVSSRIALLKMLVAAFVPFAALVPILVLGGWGTGEFVDPAVLMARIGTTGLTAAVVVVGLMGAFLSSFDSAVITAVHIFSEKKRRNPDRQLTDLDRFHLLMGLSFLIVVFIALALATRVPNAYLLGNVLMAPYALVGGLIIGTRFLERPLHSTWPTAGAVVILLVWLFLFMANPSWLAAASEDQIETVPIGVAIMIAAYVISRLASRREQP